MMTIHGKLYKFYIFSWAPSEDSQRMGNLINIDDKVTLKPSQVGDLPTALRQDLLQVTSTLSHLCHKMQNISLANQRPKTKWRQQNRLIFLLMIMIMITACSTNPPDDNWSRRRDVFVHRPHSSCCSSWGSHPDHRNRYIVISFSSSSWSSIFASTLEVQ